jgi:hypothetical protein
MKKIYLLIFIFSINAIYLYSQNNVYNLLNKEIILSDNGAGQSLVLVNENGNYYIYRKIFGSGVPYIGTIKYNVIFISDYKIIISEIISKPKNLEDLFKRDEVFEILYVNELNIYLNGIRIYVLNYREF